MLNKQYLGDSVYIDFDGFHVILTIENGLGPSNTIYLDPQVVVSLKHYLSLIKEITEK